MKESIADLLTENAEQELMDGITNNLITAEIWNDISPAVSLKFPYHTKEYLYMFEQTIYYTNRINTATGDTPDEIQAIIDSLTDQRTTTIQLIKFVISYDLVHVLNEGALYFRQYSPKIGSDFIKCDPSKFIETKVGIFRSGKSNRYILFQVLSDLGRAKHLKGISFESLPPEFYNMAPDPNLWLKPVFYHPHNSFFDLLFEALVPIKEVRERLFECIVWKYLHPEDINLPSPIFCGAGGVGKSGVGQIFKTIVGNRDVSWSASITQDSIKNTGFMLGKWIVNFDDLPIIKKDSVEHGFIKSVCHNKTFLCRNLYEKGYDADTTMWAWFNGNSTNEEKCPVPLCGDGELGVDRRFMPIIVHEDLLTIFRKHYPELPNGDLLYLINYGFTEVCTNREEVGKWLGNLLMEHTPEQYPKTIHSADYQKLCNQVSYHIQRVADFISEQNEDFISVTDAYETYLIYAKNRIDSKYLIKMDKFKSSLASLLPLDYQFGRWNRFNNLGNRIYGWKKFKTQNPSMNQKVKWLNSDNTLKDGYDL